MFKKLDSIDHNMWDYAWPGIFKKERHHIFWIENIAIEMHSIWIG